MVRIFEQEVLENRFDGFGESSADTFSGIVRESVITITAGRSLVRLGAKAFVATHWGSVIGFAVLKSWVSGFDSHQRPFFRESEIEFWLIAIESRFRRQGIGARLAQYLMRRSMDVKPRPRVVFARCRPDAGAGISMLEKCGFVRHEARPNLQVLELRLPERRTRWPREALAKEKVVDR